MGKNTNWWKKVAAGTLALAMVGATLPAEAKDRRQRNNDLAKVLMGIGGALVGGGIGYETNGENGAIVGAIIGGIAGVGLGIVLDEAGKRDYGNGRRRALQGNMNVQWGFRNNQCRPDAYCGEVMPGYKYYYPQRQDIICREYTVQTWRGSRYMGKESRTACSYVGQDNWQDMQDGFFDSNSESGFGNDSWGQSPFDGGGRPRDNGWDNNDNGWWNGGGNNWGNGGQGQSPDVMPMPGQNQGVNCGRPGGPAPATCPYPGTVR